MSHREPQPHSNRSRGVAVGAVLLILAAVVAVYLVLR